MNARAIHYDQASNRDRLSELCRRGVEVWGEGRVFINSDVPIDAIAPGTIIMNAIISGESIRIGSGSVIGASGTAFLHNACLGDDVELGAGTYEDCVLLHGVKIRGFAEVRAGTILEEEVRLGHNVGLKNSILTCWTTAGSCINFCDVFMTGGTSRYDHSEIGSGAMHLNFSPRRDKFASRFGEVRGLLLRSKPVFVGGNSSVVAPSEIACGEIIPAGVTIRPRAKDSKDYKLEAGLRFLAMLRVFRSWYEFVRLPFSSPAEQCLFAAAIRHIDAQLAFRISELERYCGRVNEPSAPIPKLSLGHEIFLEMLGSAFLDVYGHARNRHGHVAAIRELPDYIAVEVESGLSRALEWAEHRVVGI